jgi:hypothetical protein
MSAAPSKIPGLGKAGVITLIINEPHLATIRKAKRQLENFNG